MYNLVTGKPGILTEVTIAQRRHLEATRNLVGMKAPMINLKGIAWWKIQVRHCGAAIQHEVCDRKMRFALVVFPVHWNWVHISFNGSL